MKYLFSPIGGNDPVSSKAPPAVVHQGVDLAVIGREEERKRAHDAQDAHLIAFGQRAAGQQANALVQPAQRNADHALHDHSGIERLPGAQIAHAAEKSDHRARQYGQVFQ